MKDDVADLEVAEAFVGASLTHAADIADALRAALKALERTTEAAHLALARIRKAKEDAK